MTSCPAGDNRFLREIIDPWGLLVSCDKLYLSSGIEKQFVKSHRPIPIKVGIASLQAFDQPGAKLALWTGAVLVIHWLFERELEGGRACQYYYVSRNNYPAKD